jgi:transketolase
MRDSFIKSISNQAKKNKKVILLTGDLGFKIFDDFQKKFKNQFINVGVAEQNMVGIASGLAIKGYRVVIYSIANFATFRCLEQIRNDASYHNLNITIVASGGGFTYGSLGMSHHATEDISIMRSIPNIKVFVPSSAWETFNVTNKIISMPGVKYLRIEKNSIIRPINKNFNIFKPNYYKKGKDGCILTSGSILKNCIEASELLSNEISLDVISINCLKPINLNFLKKISKKKYIISVEEHNFSGGIGSLVLEGFNQIKKSKLIKIISLKDVFSSIVGDQEYLKKINQIDTKSIVKKIRSFILND